MSKKIELEDSVKTRYRSSSTIVCLIYEEVALAAAMQVLTEPFNRALNEALTGSIALVEVSMTGCRERVPF